MVPISAVKMGIENCKILSRFCRLLHFNHNQVYDNIIKKLNSAREKLKRPLSLTEKIIFSHSEVNNVPGKTNTFDMHADHLALDDRLALLTIQQFIVLGTSHTHLPCSLHCDGVISEKYIRGKHLKERPTNYDKELYDFFSSAAVKYEMDFWEPGSGSLHQVSLDNYVYPGCFMLATDFYASYGGGLGGICMKINSSQAVEAMCGQPLSLISPYITGVHIHGSLKNFASSHDVVSKLADALKPNLQNVNIVEYYGPATEELSCSEMAGICQMGADIGITASVFPYTNKMHSYLIATGRSHIADMAEKYRSDLLTADKEAKYQHTIDLDLNKIVPNISIPFNPSVNIPISTFGTLLKEKSLPVKLQACLIGKHSTISYKDMCQCAEIAKKAMENGLKAKVPLKIIAGSQNIMTAMENEGIAETLRKFGAECPADSFVEADVIRKTNNDSAAIITSCNRESLKVSDITPNFNAFVASPPIVTAFSITGSLEYNPLSEQLKGVSGHHFGLQYTSMNDFPQKGFLMTPPSVKKSKSNIADINSTPDRTWVKLLKPFPTFFEDYYHSMLVLIKVKGRCNTEDISPHGPWLKYCGHLDKICNNLLILARNAENNQVNKVKNQITGKWSTVPAAAQTYKSLTIPWVIVAENDFGAGHDNELIALQLRYMGCQAIIAKSFAEQTKNHLKRNGLIPLEFLEATNYNDIQSSDRITILDIENIMPSKPLKIELRRKKQLVKHIEVKHDLNNLEIIWLKDGSAINYLKKRMDPHSKMNWDNMEQYIPSQDMKVPKPYNDDGKTLPSQ